MNAVRIATILVAAALLASRASADDEKVLLRQRYAPGSYLVTTNMTADQKTTVGETDQPPRHIERLMVMKLTIAEPDAKGDKKLQVTYERIRHVIGTGDNARAYDSAGPADEQDPALARVFAPLLIAKVEAAVNSRGEFLQVSGPEALLEDTGRLGPSTQPAPPGRGRFGPDAVRDMLNQTYAMLPKRPVSVGDKWQNNMELNLPLLGRINLPLDCKLESLAGGGALATITWTGALEAQQPTETEMMGRKLRVKTSSTKQTGKAEFDASKGVAVATAVTMDRSLDMAITHPGGQDVPMKVEQKITMTTTFEPYAARKQAPARGAKLEGPAGG